MKKLEQKTSRIMIVDLFRIVFIGFIMMLHFLFLFGDNSATIRTRSSYIFVEAFFIITGYLTVRHFKKKDSDKNIDDIARDSIAYTFSKFKTFLPYVVIAVLIGFFGTFLYKNYTITQLVLEICKFPLEFLYGTVFFPANHCGPLWYLSAMFIVFPFFCMIAQAKKYKNLRNVFCLALAIIFLLVNDGHPTEFFPALYRTFSSLVLGLLVYEVAEWLKTKSFKKNSRVFLQILEIALFSFVIFCVLHHGDFVGAFTQIRFDVILSFVIIFALIFSKTTYSHSFNLPFVSSASKLVLPLFLVHENIAIILYHLNLGLPFNVIMLIYYATSILVAVLSYLIVKKFSIRK